MNKILKLSAIALLASSTSLMAQSKSFEGASIAAYASTVGATVDGSLTNSNNEVTTGTIGKNTPIAGLDLAYTMSSGSNGFVGLGATYVPMKAKFGAGNSSGTPTVANNGEIKDHYSVYIQPGYAITKDSALYGKVSYNHADFTITGANVSRQPGNLEGWGYGVGLKTFLTPNAFVQVEASYTEYDTLKATETANSTTSTVTGKPKISAGTVTIGYKF